MAGRTSLFGSVMQQVGHFSSTRNRDDATAFNMKSPSKIPANTSSFAVNGNKITTPQHQKVRSAFTPDDGGSSQSQAKKDLPFGSPGGFQLLDFTNNFGNSPFSKHSNLSNQSNRSANSKERSHGNNNNNDDNHDNGDSDEWQSTSLEQGVMDFSLPESIRFDCHPGNTVHSLLRQQHQSSSLGMIRFLQPSVPPITDTHEAMVSTSSSLHENNDRKDKMDKMDALAQWGSGLLFWQHPAVYPLNQFGDKHERDSKAEERKRNSKVEQTRGENQQRQLEQQLLKKKNKRSSTVDMASSTVTLSEVRSAENNIDDAQRSSSEKQWTRFQRYRRSDWRQAFSSLYWKWISQVKQLNNRTCESNLRNIVVFKTYFCSLGEDHAVLFRAVVDSSGKVIPNITIASSSAAFRDKLRYSGVEKLCLTEAWNGHCAGAVFAEEMIQQNNSQGTMANPSKGGPLKDVSVNNIAKASEAEARMMTPSKIGSSGNSTRTGGPEEADATSKLLSPTKTSNSPMVEEELAALRRAQVFGQTVGADFTISIKPNKTATTGPKLELKSVPPLFVSGWDDCAAFFEVYLNLGSSCVTPYKTEAQLEKKGNDQINGKPNRQLQSKLTQTTRWKLPKDVTLLVCRGMGPFLHSTMKTLTVRGDPHNPGEKKRETVSPQTQLEQDYSSLEILGGPILPCAIMDCFRGLVRTMVIDKQRTTSSLQSDDDSSGDVDALVGSHNLVLHAFHSEHAASDTEKSNVNATFTIGSSRTHTFNHCSVDQIRSDDDDGENSSTNLVPHVVKGGHVLGMTVWDILHPQAMAYKTDPYKDPTSSSLLFPS